MRFCVGETIDDVWPQLFDSWWGIKKSLHIDVYADLSAFDGYRVEVCDAQQAEQGDTRLWFVNCGFYEPGVFGEGHAYRFFIGDKKPAVWKRVLSDVSKDFKGRHMDDFAAVDDLIDIGQTLFDQGVGLRMVRDQALDGKWPEMVSDYIPYRKRKASL